jgi:hypothetical protein
MMVMILFTALAFVLLIAMAAGQFRVAYRAINHGKAGFGRFIYKRADAPRAFWIAVVAEWLGFALIFVYGLLLVTKALFE